MGESRTAVGERAPGPPGLSLDSLRVERGGRTILAGGSVTAPERAAVLCTGPNGSGKTTLLEALAGLLPVAGGTVTFAGEQPDLASGHWRARVAYCPSDGGTIGLLTAAEQLALVLELAGVSATAAAERSERLTGLFDLHAVLHTRADVMSTGTRKRLGLAIVSAVRSPVVLLDEPSAGLDVDGVMVLRHTISALKDAGAVVVITSHAPEILEDMVDARWSLVPGDGGARLVAGDPGAPTPDADDCTTLAGLPWLHE